MSQKYKFGEKWGAYFISFATVMDQVQKLQEI
jgi:hypothetical protein